MTSIDLNIKNTIGGMFFSKPINKNKAKKTEKQSVDKSAVDENYNYSHNALTSDNLIQRSSVYNSSLSSPVMQRSSSYTVAISDEGIVRSSKFVFDLSNTWWKKIPLIFSWWTKILCFPLILIKNITDFILSLFISTIFIAIGLWYFEIITDEVVTGILQGIGDRGLSILSALGVPI